jgi:predicted dehydrogenase
VTTPLRVGVAGLGRIFDLHHPGYRDHPDARIVALCDASDERLRARAAQFPEARAFRDYAAFLREGLDLVEVLTPHPLHHDMVVAALRAGAHVSVQKPMAMTLAEADAMLAAAREARRTLRVFENFVFYPPLVKARALLAEGAIGRPLHFRMKMLSGNRELAWPVAPDTQRWRQALMEQGRGGPLVFDHGHHMLAVALWLFGDVADGFARIDATRLPTGAVVDAPASLMWRHRDPFVHAVWDVTAAPRLRIRTDYYAGHEQFEITGETGVIQVHRCSDRFLDEPVLTLYADGEVRAFHNLEQDWGLSFRRSTEHLVRALRGEEARPVLTGEEGRRVLALALLLIRSAREGRPLETAGPPGGDPVGPGAGPP